MTTLSTNGEPIDVFWIVFRKLLEITFLILTIYFYGTLLPPFLETSGHNGLFHR